MRFKIGQFGVLLALGFAGGTMLSPPPAWATSNVTYNFNEDNGSEVGWFSNTSGTAPLWDWNTGPSVIGGGWQAFSGTNSANSASYLTSPCFVINTNTSQQYVNFVVRHRFNFPVIDETANQLGQIQYRLDTTGTGWGAWSGIPTQYFVKPNGNPDPQAYNPNYGPPLFLPLIDLSGTMAVQALSGTTTGFASGNHHPTEFTLQFADFGLQNGYEIQFRFAMATDVGVTGTNTVVWEVNSVQIDGVYECPEPGTLALAGIGGLGCLLAARRRRRRRPVPALRAVCGSTAATIAVVVVVACLLVAAPARAQTSTSWNFQLDDGNWTTAGERLKQPPNAAAFWNWTSPSIAVNGGPNPHWHVTSEGTTKSTASSYSITSPVLTTTGTVNSARISIAHDFLFRTGTGVTPLYSGQFQYQLNNSGTWVGLPLSAFTSGSVNVFSPDFGFSPFWSDLTQTVQLVDQSTFLLPNYLTPTGSGTLPFLAPGAAAFTGTSPGWPNAYVPTQAILSGTALVPAIGIQSLQVRFANLNYGAGCLPEDGWNVKFVQVDFSDAIDPVPEPATLALAGLGLAALGAKAAARRWAYQRASRPSDRP